MDELLTLCKALRELGVASYRGPMPGVAGAAEPDVEIKFYPATYVPESKPEPEPVPSDPPRNQVERFDRAFPGMVRGR